MWGLLSVVGVVAALAAILLAVIGARWAAAKLLRVRGIRFLPYRGNQGWVPVARYKQLLCITAGIAAAYAVPSSMFASALLIGGRVHVAAPEERGTRVDAMPGRAAEAAGVKNGDVIVSVAGEPVSRWNELAKAVQSHPRETIELVIDRDGERVVLDVEVPPEGRIGVVLGTERLPVGFGEAFATGMGHPALVTLYYVRSITRWLIGDVEAEVSGPVGIIRESQNVGERSFLDWLELTAARVSFYGLPLACLMAFIVRVRREPALIPAQRYSP